MKLAIALTGLALVTTGCSKSTGTITIEEGGTTCKVETRAAVVHYAVTLDNDKATDTTYTVAVRSQVPGEEKVLKEGTQTIPNAQTRAVEVVVVDRPALVQFTDPAGTSVVFTIRDPKQSVCK